ncbi:hypothetical protein PSACC_01445 [Paramicrosporidium saccamoebae]|uniref:Uncharacterized protein n=1 Tax=Paramicrosporidium saccamoebae TaxID=1246581 RepID=A0A2H9TLT2_9FUNG|nr:hypothetical protein PSACC_01445 [Paramicrosporidium saccamoebae]
MAIVGAIAVASATEIFAFLTLSLILQVLARLSLSMSWLASASLLCSTWCHQSLGSLKRAKQMLVMLVTSLFLATVTKTPFVVRFELVGVYLISLIAFVLARVVNAELVELYARAVARLSCLALVGYSVITEFDSTFSGIVRKSAGFTASYVQQIKGLLKIK